MAPRYRVSRLPQGGEFIEARSAGAMTASGRWSRLPQGGEFIEACAPCQARHIRSRCLAFPREASSSRPERHRHLRVGGQSRLPQGGEFIEASVMVVRTARAWGLAFPREASSSRLRRSGVGTHSRRVSPSPGRRVHRGRRTGGSGSRGRGSRLPQGGEFIEAPRRWLSAPPSPSLAFPREASSSRPGHERVGDAAGVSRLPQGGEFIEARRGAGLPFDLGESRLPQGGEFIEATRPSPTPRCTAVVSPSPGRRVHRGELGARLESSCCSGLAFPREASSSRRSTVEPATDEQIAGLAFPREASSSRHKEGAPLHTAALTSRLPQGGEFIEAPRPAPSPPPPSVSPSPGRRVHRGGQNPA